MVTESGKIKNPFGMVVIIAIVLATILANAAAIILPVFLPVLAHSRGLTEAQAGLFAFAVYGGIGIGSMACAMLPRVVERLNWRWTAVLGLIAVISASLAMAAVQGVFALYVLAVVSGIGAGLVNAVLCAICAEGDGARLIAAFLAAQIGFGAAAVALVSPIVDHHGEAGAFLTLAALGAAALLLCPLLPTGSLAQSSPEHSVSPGSDRISGMGWAVVVGLLLYFVASGASYGFLGYMGMAWGGKPAAVASAISGIMIIGMIGTLVVMLVGSRFGYVWPLAILMIANLVALVLFIEVRPVAAFLPIGGLLYFSMNTGPAYLFDVLTDVDGSTGAAMMLGASQFGGFAIGPAIAGYLVTPDYGLVNLFSTALLIAASLIVFGVVWLHRRQSLRFLIDTPAQAEG